jgi:hypothetical protein
METTRLSTKGQIVLPKGIRDSGRRLSQMCSTGHPVVNAK